MVASLLVLLWKTFLMIKLIPTSQWRAKSLPKLDGIHHPSLFADFVTGAKDITSDSKALFGVASLVKKLYEERVLKGLDAYMPQEVASHYKAVYGEMMPVWEDAVCYNLAAHTDSTFNAIASVSLIETMRKPLNG